MWNAGEALNGMSRREQQQDKSKQREEGKERERERERAERTVPSGALLSKICKRQAQPALPFFYLTLTFTHSCCSSFVLCCCLLLLLFCRSGILWSALSWYYDSPCTGEEARLIDATRATQVIGRSALCLSWVRLCPLLCSFLGCVETLLCFSVTRSVGECICTYLAIAVRTTHQIRSGKA